MTVQHSIDITPGGAGPLSTAETSVSWVNSSGLAVEQVQGTVDGVAREIANWVATTQGRVKSSLFDRSAYVAPDNPYNLMAVGRGAVENDDVVGGVCDVTEGLTFQGIKWESENPDDADVFNQINRDLNMDEFARMWHREDFKYSQVVIGVWWGRRTYTVRGRTQVEDKDAEPVVDPLSVTGMKPKMKQGPKRRKKYEVVCPVALTFLDPMKVVPMPPGPFGQDRLAWFATKDEMAVYNSGVDGAYGDPVMAEFFNGKVTGLSRSEEATLSAWGIDPKRLIWLNPRYVFRFCRTKASYERFPENRLKSVFPLLDLKQQLMEADRVSLVGAANYILLVKKGTKDDPAEQTEIDNLKENFKVVAKLPVIVGDHRLEIEIITPDQQYTLDSKKYDTLDRRILSRTLGALTISTDSQNESTLTVARGVARLLEGRRHMMKRALEYQIARAVVDHPMNAGKFESEPNLTFTPRNVQLDADSTVTQQIMALRTQKELSRESVLEYFGFDQATEAQRREYEEASGLDDIFQTQVPFSATGQQGPNGGPVDPSVSGAQGGRPTGGGKTKQSPQAQSKPKSSGGNTSTRK